MKRVKVAPGRFVMVSKGIQDRIAGALAQSPFTKEKVDEIAKREPRGVTAMVGPSPRHRRPRK
jgi:hypothetical protein